MNIFLTLLFNNKSTRIATGAFIENSMDCIIKLLTHYKIIMLYSTGDA